MKFKTSIITKEAAEIVNFTNKYHRVPKTAAIGNTTLSKYSIAYLLSKVIQDKFLKTETNLINVRIYDPSEKYSDTINMNVMKDDYMVMVNNFIKFSNKYHRVPRFITVPSTKTKVSFELYLYGVSKIVNYYKNNKRLPNYCNLNKATFKQKETSNKTTKKSSSKSTSNSTKTRFVSKPHYLDKGCNMLGQCTPYWCGPHSIHQILKKFGITKYSEKQIASYAGSTTSGTDHNGINTAIAKISKETGIKLKVAWKNFSDMGKTDDERFKEIGKLLADKNTAVLWHILYTGAGESIEKDGYGHYEVIDIINISTKYVRALNSLGTKKNDGTYPGHLQDRKYGIQAYFARNTPGNQAALCIVQKV